MGLPHTRREKEPLPVSVTFEEYQRESGATAIYPGAGDQTSILGLSYVGLGLGEAGEIQGKIKKILRDCDGEITIDHRLALKAEAGDLMWYLARLCDHLGFSMSEVAQANLDKLFDRQERGVLQGSGDNR
jgi:NTP pyrophosphatase (non-canonical NTP hydrolase)